MSQFGTSAEGTSAGLRDTGAQDISDIGEPEHKVCTICNSTFNAQEDYQTHVSREHPKSMAAEET